MAPVDKEQSLLKAAQAELKAKKQHYREEIRNLSKQRDHFKVLSANSLAKLKKEKMRRVELEKEVEKAIERVRLFWVASPSIIPRFTG